MKEGTMWKLGVVVVLLAALFPLGIAVPDDSFSAANPPQSARASLSSNSKLH